MGILIMKAQTTIKEALSKWEQKSGEKACDAKEIRIYGCYPPIQKLDPTLSTLQNVEKLSLSTNGIDKISNISQLNNLKILSLSRNYIKSLAGLEGVADTLVELWLSYNQIEKLKGINCMKKLEVLYMSNNYVKDWAEFNKLIELPCLENLLFTGNPLEEKHSADGTWRKEVQKRLPNLKKLDGIPVINEIEDEISPIAAALSKEETPSDKVAT